MLVKRRDEFGADASSAVGGHIRHTRAHIDDAVHRLRGEFETAQRVMAEQMAAQMDARLGELKAEVAVQLNETRQLRETVTSRMDAMIVAMRPLREMAFAQDGSGSSEEGKEPVGWERHSVEEAKVGGGGVEQEVGVGAGAGAGARAGARTADVAVVVVEHGGENKEATGARGEGTEEGERATVEEGKTGQTVQNAVAVSGDVGVAEVGEEREKDGDTAELGRDGEDVGGKEGEGGGGKGEEVDTAGAGGKVDSEGSEGGGR
jgi:hypothetical protein